MYNHYIWIDRVKLLACLLVLLGHYISGIIISGIIDENNFFNWFSNTIYYFHVPLFFFCSGYLYQHKSKVNTYKEWKKNCIRKLIALGVPYCLFTIITILMKTISADYVNNQAPTLFNTLFFEPIAPYWYLYVLFFIFMITKTFTNKKELGIYVILSIIVKIIICCVVNSKFYIFVPYSLRGVMINEIWFVAGMCISFYKSPKMLVNVAIKSKRKYYILLILSIITSIIVFKLNMKHELISFILGIMFCVSIIGVIISTNNIKVNRLESFFSKYTMPIFLMHTICAAAARILLIKIHIISPVIHIIIGFLASTLIPIFIMRIMEKFDILEFFIYPNKVLKRRENQYATKN